MIVARSRPARTQLGDPRRTRGRPFAADDPAFQEREPPFGVGLPGEGHRRRVPDIIRTPIPHLIAPRAAPPDASEATAPPLSHVTSAEVIGWTVPAAMNSPMADSGMRCRRPLVGSRCLLQSDLKRRGKRAVVPSRSAASATLNSRSMIIFLSLIWLPSDRCQRGPAARGYREKLPWQRSSPTSETRRRPQSSTTANAASTSPASSACRGVADSPDGWVLASTPSTAALWAATWRDRGD